MSRAQQSSVFNQTQDAARKFTTQANNSYGATQNDIDTYGEQIGAFQAANPYVQGGQFQTAQNQTLADTAAGGAEAAGQALQSAATRTGANPGGAIAATEEMNRENQRNLMGNEAEANKERIAAGTGYAEAGLGMLGQKEGMQERLGQAEEGAAQGQLSAEEQAAQQPSFWDIIGKEDIADATRDQSVAFAQGAGKAVGGMG